jgi:hypothetical protein
MRGNESDKRCFWLEADKAAAANGTQAAVAFDYR